MCEYVSPYSVICVENLSIYVYNMVYVCMY